MKSLQMILHRISLVLSNPFLPLAKTPETKKAPCPKFIFMMADDMSWPDVG